ncbi:Serine/threonine protein kinase PrkC, regulator of stationary phase [Photobacterium marinum]|uniref:Serine/threonine protein kinase PrkC, regulator of stationary phase n=1 Tax=Photobacterium marinum TaxID=1056511 RepID=L8JAG4_9GAMM|nr:protein kinase [Photobacterium marinum]ELR65855.1 Serine/threonine protein kinase PrkC, regulator of stationary phase [Photobacterium marinum]
MEKCGNYFIEPLCKIGKGAFGYVEKMRLYNSNKHLCGEYARKVFNPEPDILEKVTEEELKRRFKREILYQANLFSKNIVPIYLFDDRVTHPYFVMSLAEGDLDSDLEAGLLFAEDKIKCINDILNGVEAVHEKGYLHRDLKPQNILRYSETCDQKSKTKELCYKVSDFGLVKDTKPDADSTVLTAIGTCMGSRPYMAPEAQLFGEYSIQSDIYSIGKIIKDIGFNNTEVEKVISRCLLMEKSQRYRSVTDLKLELNKALLCTAA